MNPAVHVLHINWQVYKSHVYKFKYCIMLYGKQKYVNKGHGNSKNAASEVNEIFQQTPLQFEN